MDNEKMRALKNTFMLYLMNFSKMIFPLLTLPYLTRVLSVDCYGMVAYVKAIMQYMQLILIFGFTLSATKDIVNADGNKKKIGEITADVLVAKIILACIAFIFLLGMICFIPLLRKNIIYTLLSYVNIVITELLADFLFRGLDKMEVITIRFVISKLVSTILTFIFIKNDSVILFIPIFDILGSLIAFILVIIEIKKIGLKLHATGLMKSIQMLKESFIYFASDMATTAFGAFNTLLIGIFINETQVAYWSLAMQLVSAVQSLYTPITNGIYPTMIRTKSVKIIKDICIIFLPLVFLGCVFCMIFAKYILILIGGKEYIDAVFVFRCLIPVLFISFPAMLFGWPALGVINKQKETTITTLITAIVQISGLFFLLFINEFNLISIALLRVGTETLMLVLRLKVFYKFRKEYN